MPSRDEAAAKLLRILPQVPRRIVLDVDDTFDAVHGGPQMRLSVARRRATDNAHRDGYGFQPIVMFDGEGRFVSAVLRPAKQPSRRETRAFLRQFRANWPRVEILLRADSHPCRPSSRLPGRGDDSRACWPSNASSRAANAVHLHDPTKANWQRAHNWC